MKRKIYRHHRFLSRKTKHVNHPSTSLTPPPATVTSPLMVPDTPAPSSKLAIYLNSHYNLRVNLLTEQAEYQPLSPDGSPTDSFRTITKRQRNTMLTELNLQGIQCNVNDLQQYCYSDFVPAAHPFTDYMNQLPQWDGHDRVITLGMRVSTDATWLMVFRRWMRMMAAQWMAAPMRTANMMVPILISRKQGTGKSTFCRMLMPPQLTDYYMDKLDFSQKAEFELKMAQFGLINLDEFDRYGQRLMPLFKNVMQMKTLVTRRAYASTFSNLPRIASFIATTNNKHLLSDETGSRRFYCQEVTAPIDCTPPDYQQLYAQLRHEVNEGLPLYFTKDEEALIEAHNYDYYRMNTLQQAILRCYRQPDEEEEFMPLLARTIRDTVQKRYPKMVAGTTLRHFADELRRIVPTITRSSQGHLYPLVKI